MNLKYWSYKNTKEKLYPYVGELNYIPLYQSNKIL